MNKYILVTRPGLQGNILCEKIAAASGQALHFPTIEFVSAGTARRAPTEQYDWVIFISRQAVEQSLPWVRQYVSEKTHIATIGEGTASLLRSEGFAEVVYPMDEWTSEGLLNLPFFQQIQQQKILLIRGEGGRETLAQTLTARGANVEHLIVYRRIVPLSANINEYLDLLRAKKIGIIVCASGESLHNLMTMTGAAYQSQLQAVPLIVVSQRLATLAKELNFQQIFLAANASHDAIIETLCFIKGKSHVK